MAEVISTYKLLSSSAGIAGYIVFLFFLSRIVPGRRDAGRARETGDQWLYTLNGLWIFLCVMGLTFITELSGLSLLLSIHENFWNLFILANVFAFAMTFILYYAGCRSRGTFSISVFQAIREMTVGVEHNPRWWKVDLKMFSYRPSLIGLALINLSFAAVQFQTYGFLSDAMLLYQVFTFVYIFNYFQYEYGMLFTWDVIAEKFGWMLVWGDYVLVPFFYSLPGWFLVHSTEPVPNVMSVTVVIMFIFGFWLFRGANEQKHRFKRDKTVRIWGKQAKTIDDLLLISGFWGIGRHLNYTGEILIYFSFTLTTGFDSLVPYLLPAWLTGLLVQRAWRDEVRCRSKYKETWEKYTRIARFRIIPFIY